MTSETLLQKLQGSDCKDDVVTFFNRCFVGALGGHTVETAWQIAFSATIKFYDNKLLLYAK